MNIIDKLKDMFNKIFKKEEQAKALPEAYYPQNNFRTFYRNDGTSIDVMPVLDKLGNQAYEQVLNYNTGEIQYLPKYNISSKELENYIGCDMTSILMDVDKNILDNPQYSDYIANVFLGTDRMSKIINEYEKYAGGMEIDDTGAITSRYVDSGIISGLKENRQQNYIKYQQEQENRDADFRREKMEQAKNHAFEVKTSHAEDLSER